MASPAHKKRDDKCDLKLKPCVSDMGCHCLSPFRRMRRTNGFSFGCRGPAARIQSERLLFGKNGLQGIGVSPHSTTGYRFQFTSKHSDVRCQLGSNDARCWPGILWLRSMAFTLCCAFCVNTSLAYLCVTNVPTVTRLSIHAEIPSAAAQLCPVARLGGSMPFM